MGLKRCASGAGAPPAGLFAEASADWVEVDLKRVKIERKREFGGPWIGLELMRRLQLDQFLFEHLPAGREEVPWPLMAMVLVLGRLCYPSSELGVAARFYESSALADLLGVPAEKVNEDRLYRALDALLPHKPALEKHLKEKLGELFTLDYDLLLYDVTSTYFEGQAKGNPQALRGYSRDHRPDCKQVNIALVVSRCGMPLGYEVFAGNRHDATTVKEIVNHMEALYGRADRIWVMDRGMVSEENLEFLRAGGRRYILGTAKQSLRKFEQELLAKDWHLVQEGLEVQIIPAPEGQEVFILCRSRDRQKKEQAMHERFENRVEQALTAMAAHCEKTKQNPLTIALIGPDESRRHARLLGQNTRAAGLFDVHVEPGADGRTRLHWSKVEAWREWARLSEGCYLLRSNVIDWNAEDLWRAYIQLTEAEAAFRVHKSDLSIRPVWHHKQDRVQAHILVCFLAYVLWKTLSATCHHAGLGDEPRQVFEALSEIALVDVVLHTRNGVVLRKRCISQPSEHQQILLQRLTLKLPIALEKAQM